MDDLTLTRYETCLRVNPERENEYDLNSEVNLSIDLIAKELGFSSKMEMLYNTNSGIYKELNISHIDKEVAYSIICKKKMINSLDVNYFNQIPEIKELLEAILNDEEFILRTYEDLIILLYDRIEKRNCKEYRVCRLLLIAVELELEETSKAISSWLWLEIKEK